MANNFMNLEMVIKGVNANVNRMVYMLDGFSVNYTRWIEYYLEYRALKKYVSYNEEFKKLLKDLGIALINADVSCTIEEEKSYNEWCKSIEQDLGYSRKMEIK